MNETFTKMGAFELRAACREKATREGTATSWISSANKDACVAYLTAGEIPEHKAPTTTNDDTANALMNAIRAVASGSLDADAVRAIVQEETANLKAETFDESAIRKIVDAAVLAFLLTQAPQMALYVAPCSCALGANYTEHATAPEDCPKHGATAL